MSIFRIAWKSIQQRGVASCLTMLSMSLGVMLVVLVLSIHGIVTESFRSNSTLGYHLIIGARGGALQLTMNSVFYLSKPVENVPYEYYLAFLKAEERRAELENSIAYKAKVAQRETGEMLAASQLGIGGGLASLASEIIHAESVKIDEDQLGLNEDGMFSNFSRLAIPLCLGDYFGEYRVVGTTPALFDELIYDSERDRHYEFSKGRNFQTFSEENGYFECVVGSIVAKRKGVKVGDKINPTHGAPDAHAHEQQFTVVGILAPSGTPNDRAVFVNMEGFFLINDHAKPVESDEAGDTEEDTDEAEWEEFLQHSLPSASGLALDAQPALDNSAQSSTAVAIPMRPVSYRPSAAMLTSQQDKPADPSVDSPEEGRSAGATPGLEDHPRWADFVPLPIEQREVTSILVLADDALTGGDLAAMHISNKVNEGILEGSLNWSNYRPRLAQKSAQGVQPISEIERLFQAFVGPVRYLLLTLTVMICVVSGISILVSIYNSMSERRHEIAVMRALGASRDTIMLIVLAESVIISLLGGMLGWGMAHGIVEIIAPFVEAQTGVTVGFFSFVTAELWVLPGVLVLAVMVGFYPAISAYFTDVSQSLGK